jgi:hypothetical protein
MKPVPFFWLQKKVTGDALAIGDSQGIAEKTQLPQIR